MEVKKVLEDDVKEACNEHDDKVKDVREQKETSLGYSLVSDGEKILALDAMALLGGNEYFIQQTIDKLCESSYSETESMFITASLKLLWNTVPELPKPFNLSNLLSFLSALHKERLERIMASCLLYSSRYNDTQVIMLQDNPTCRMMMVNLCNIPGSDPPVGKTVDGEPCSCLVILYHWTCPRSTSNQMTQNFECQPHMAYRGRKISASLALERQMLSIVDVFAVLPAPSLLSMSSKSKTAVTSSSSSLVENVDQVLSLVED